MVIKGLHASVFFEEPSGYPSEYKGAWIAQCLEKDCCAQGKTREQAIERLEQTLGDNASVCVQRGLAPLSNLDAAPEFYWNHGDRVELGR